MKNLMLIQVIYSIKHFITGTTSHYPQWTIIGASPSLGWLWQTLLMKVIKAVANWGTPWSGHLVKKKCLTSKGISVSSFWSLDTYQYKKNLVQDFINTSYIHTLVTVIVFNSQSAKRWIWISLTESDGLGLMVSLTLSGQYCSHFSMSASTILVIMMITEDLWSHTIYQKSLIISSNGPIQSI